jgi:hypothetical protein
MKLELNRVKRHFAEAKANNGVGLEDPNDIRETFEDHMPKLAKQMATIRAGMHEDKKGVKAAPREITLEDALKLAYGITTKDYLKALGIFTQSDTLYKMGQKFGLEGLNKRSFEDLMVGHSNFGLPASTQDINSDYRFIIPEVVAQAVRVGYQHAALHPNWIAATQNLSQQKLTMPQILRGDAMPTRVNEGANIPMGSLAFGKKEVEVFKLGTGFSVTDELMMAATLDMFFLFLQEVGSDMSIGADTLAVSILVNGEQTDGSESAPVIGAEAAAALAPKDLRRIRSRMGRLKNTVTRAIMSEDDTLLDLNASNTSREEKTPAEYLGVPVDNWVLPPGQSLYLNSRNTMVKLTYRGLLTERRRNPQKQEEELFISDWIGFAIIRRDGRVILDKDVTFASTPFPSYMDIDARINQAFNEF